MSIKYSVQAVLQLYTKVEKKTARFKNKSGLTCVPDCGACCNKADLETTVLEFLPAADYLFRNNQADWVLDKCMQANDEGICIFYSGINSNDRGGFCTLYEYRGLICRLFGFSACLNKHGDPVLSTCKPVKTSMPQEVKKADEYIRSGVSLPVVSQYYSRLYSIDYSLSTIFYPVNKAIRLAVEKVMMDNIFRDIPA